MRVNPALVPGYGHPLPAVQWPLPFWAVDGRPVANPRREPHSG